MDRLHSLVLLQTLLLFLDLGLELVYLRSQVETLLTPIQERSKDLVLCLLEKTPPKKQQRITTIQQSTYSLQKTEDLFLHLLHRQKIKVLLQIMQHSQILDLFQGLRQMLLLPQISSLVDLLLLRIQDSSSSLLLVVVFYSPSLVVRTDSFLDILDLVQFLYLEVLSPTSVLDLLGTIQSPSDQEDSSELVLYTNKSPGIGTILILIYSLKVILVLYKVLHQPTIQLQMSMEMSIV